MVEISKKKRIWIALTIAYPAGYWLFLEIMANNGHLIFEAEVFPVVVVWGPPIVGWMIWWISRGK